MRRNLQCCTIPIICFSSTLNSTLIPPAPYKCQATCELIHCYLQLQATSLTVLFLIFLIPTVLGRVVRLNLPVRHVGQIRQTKSQSQKRSDSPVSWAKFTRGLERSTSLSFEQFAIWAKVLVKSALIEVFSSLECIRAIQSCMRTTSHSCGEGSRCIRSPFRKTIRAIRVLDRSGSRHPILAVRFRLFPLNERLLKWLKYIPCMTTMPGEGQLCQFASLGNIL